ncbi:MAG TPA: DNA helicase II, partial [Rhodospirillaceae bacterium]|nr:DNA helicase II [Rhodospirillaceae bacterium]
EERRLAYVGITRARRRAWISHVANRFVYGNWTNALPSRFIAELPDEHTEHASTLRGQNKNSSTMPSWDEAPTPRKRGPNLWQQLQATQRASGRKPPPQIEGKAREITPRKREGKINVGDHVTHKTFGTGKVRHIEGDKLEIFFDKAGVKKVVERFVTAL